MTLADDRTITTVYKLKSNLPQGVQSDIPNVLLIHQHLAAVRIVESVQQSVYGGLAATRAAHDGHFLSCRDMQGETVQDLAVRVRRVAEVHVFESDGAA